MLSGKVRDPRCPLSRFIDLGEPRFRKLRATRINCRQHRPPLTGGTHRAKTAKHTCVRDHYGTTTEGPRELVTSATQDAHYAHGCTAGKGAPAMHDHSHERSILMARFIIK
jgi:hypothetical protein